MKQAAKVKIKSRQLGKIVDGLKRRARTTEYAKALESLLPKMRRIETRVFATESDPDGVAWPRLSKYTIKEKKRLGYGKKKILVRTGRLRNSLTRVSSPDTIAKFRTFKGITTLTFGTKVPYAIYHNVGTRNIPQRRFLVKPTDELVVRIFNPAFEDLIDSLKERWI